MEGEDKLWWVPSKKEDCLVDLNMNCEPENETQSAQCTVTCLYHKPRMQFPGNSGSHHAFSLEIHCCYVY
jgi:hypothetical protein